MVWIFDRDWIVWNEQWEALLMDKGIPILHVSREPMGRDPQSPFYVNCWWLRTLYYSLIWSVSMISCIGDQPFQAKILLSWPESPTNGQTLLQTQDQLSYFEIIWPSCITRNSCGRGLIGSWYRWASGEATTNVVLTGEIAVFTVGLDHRAGGTIAEIAQRRRNL